MNELIDKIKQICLHNGSKIAVNYNNNSISYALFWQKIETYGNLLKRAGSSPVIVYGDNCIDNLIAIFSCIMANRTYIPIGSCMALERLKEIIKLTDSNLIISNQKISIENCDCLKLDELTQLKDNKCRFNTNSTAYIIFTSGSTGIPKGVPISYDNLNNFINWISSFEILREYKDMRIMNTASFSFDLSVADIFYSICNGHTLCILKDKDDLSSIFNFIKQEKINIIVSTPTFIKMCLLDDSFNSVNFKDLKCIYFCGERLDESVAKKLLHNFNNLNVLNAYGPTEATSAVSGIFITEEMLSNSLLPVGNINTCASEITIVNDEIVIKGKSVFEGYLNIKTDNCFKENGNNCFKTGDIGYIENDLIYCKGRNDNQIKYKGYRIELSDIEVNLMKIKGIINAAVVPKCSSDNIVSSIRAYVCINSDIDVSYIKSELSKLIPQYMMPKIKILEKMPINKNGKIDRKVLSEL